MNYIELAKYFDRIGRYKSADKIEKLLRKSQQINFEQSTTGKPNFGGNVTNVFDATTMGKKTQGITPELETGPGRDTVQTFTMPNFEEKQRLFKTPEGVEYFNEVMRGFKENILQVAAGLGLQGLSNRVNAIRGALNGVPPTMQAEYYMNNFDPIIINDLVRVLLTEDLQTFMGALRYTYDNLNYGNKVLESTIPNAIQQGMQQLRDIAVKSSDQTVRDKYNAAIVDPYIAQFYRAY